MGLRLQSGEISIHALREEGDLADYLGLPTKVISIHALREEGDVWSVRTTARPMIFLSTPSARRATGRLQAALHLHHDFYPRPPRGGRPSCTKDTEGQKQFLSTPSARRATRATRRHSLLPPYFYPRPPRGGRQKGQSAYPAGEDFYPRPPRGGRLLLFSGLAVDLEISIHALREEGDVRRRECGEGREISIHALREEGDRSSSCSSRRAC